MQDKNGEIQILFDGSIFDSNARKAIWLEKNTDYIQEGQATNAAIFIRQMPQQRYNKVADPKKCQGLKFEIRRALTLNIINTKSPQDSTNTYVKF